MDSQEKDRFATLVDAAFSDSLGSIEGDVSSYTFSIPTEYKQHSSLLSCDADVQRKVLSLLKETASQLENKIHLSFDDSIQDHPFGDVFAVKTTGDGDCLLHSLSLCMWGREDHFRLLRGLLSLAFSNPELSARLEELFMEEERQRDVDLGFAGAREDKLLREEYANAAARAFGVGTYLEGIHICCLSHILRRPIVVLDGEDGHRISSSSLKNSTVQSPKSPSTTMTSSSGESMAGVYLPVLHKLSKSSNSSRSPLVIVYTTSCSQHPSSQQSASGADEQNTGTTDGFSIDSAHPSYVGHFTALVGCDSIHMTSKASEIVRSIPLVTTSGNSSGVSDDSEPTSQEVSLVPMRVRFSLTKEHNVRSNDDKELINSKLLYKHLENVEYVNKRREFGYESIYLAKQALTLAPESGRGSREKSSTKDMNCLLSTTAYERRANFLEDVLWSKEDEARVLRKRLEELKQEISTVERDKADCDSFVTQSSYQDKRSLRHWRKHGEALMDQEVSPARRSRSKPHPSSPSSTSSGPPSPHYKTKSGYVRTESNESNETNETSETRGSRGSKSVKSSSRKHRESSDKIRSPRQSAESLDSNVESAKSSKNPPPPSTGNNGSDSDKRSSALSDEMKRSQVEREERWRKAEEGCVQIAIRESLKDMNGPESTPPLGTGSIVLPTTTSPMKELRSRSSSTSSSFPDSYTSSHRHHERADESRGDYYTSERHSTSRNKYDVSTEYNNGKSVSAAERYSGSARDDCYTKSLLEKHSTGQRSGASSGSSRSMYQTNTHDSDKRSGGNDDTSRRVDDLLKSSSGLNHRSYEVSNSTRGGERSLDSPYYSSTSSPASTSQHDSPYATSSSRLSTSSVISNSPSRRTLTGSMSSARSSRSTSSRHAAKHMHVEEAWK